MVKEVTCPLCEGTNSLLITKRMRFGKEGNVYKCQNCDLIFLDQNSFTMPKDFYEKEYHQSYFTHIDPDTSDPHVYHEKMKRASKIWADKFRKMLNGHEVVLDIGCSAGHFMEMVKDKTKKIYGYELNRKEVEFCRNVLNLDVTDEPFTNKFEEKTFDYITMIHVLEHIAEPKEFLISAKKLLKPEGKMIILVPNVQDALINLYDLPEFRSFYYCIEHLFYYNPKTIKRLFDNVGMIGEIEIIQEYPLANHLNWGYQRAPRNILASRKGTPDIPLKNDAPVDAWNKLWDKFNLLYRRFLKENGFSDQIWCTMSIYK